MFFWDSQTKVRALKQDKCQIPSAQMPIIVFIQHIIGDIFCVFCFGLRH